MTGLSFLPYNMRAVRKTILLSFRVYGIVGRGQNGTDRWNPEEDETVSSISNVQNQILIHDNAMNEKDISV